MLSEIKKRKKATFPPLTDLRWIPLDRRRGGGRESIHLGAQARRQYDPRLVGRGQRGTRRIPEARGENNGDNNTSERRSFIRESHGCTITARHLRVNPRTRLREKLLAATGCILFINDYAGLFFGVTFDFHYMLIVRVYV